MMKNDFFRFPSTPHLGELSVSIRADSVMTDDEQGEFLKQQLVVEEKVDGANLGISFDDDANIHAQNRGSYLMRPDFSLVEGAHHQWRLLPGWLSPKEDVLFEHLGNRYILFGEWCYAVHSVLYDQLPDWFLGLDVYDKQKGCFLSSNRRDDLFEKIGISQVPSISRGEFTFEQLKETLLKPLQSYLGHQQQAEGLYLRSNQDEDWLGERAKLVHPTFLQSIEEHWSRGPIRENRLYLGSSKAHS